jgi:hypothetical protein
MKARTGIIRDWAKPAPATSAEVEIGSVGRRLISSWRVVTLCQKKVELDQTVASYVASRGLMLLWFK